MAKLLLGKEVTDALNANLQTRTAALREKGINPTLGIIRVGANPSDLSYEKGATSRATLVGVDVKKFELPEDATREDVAAVPELKILASSEQAGVYIVMNKEGRQIFVTGHSEYDPDTLKREYLRDKNQGLPIDVPENYFPGDAAREEPIVRWRGPAHLLFSNWLNYFVYQSTPYDIMNVGHPEFVTE